MNLLLSLMYDILYRCCLGVNCDDLIEDLDVFYLLKFWVFEKW